MCEWWWWPIAWWTECSFENKIACDCNRPSMDMFSKPFLWHKWHLTWCTCHWSECIIFNYVASALVLFTSIVCVHKYYYCWSIWIACLCAHCVLVHVVVIYKWMWKVEHANSTFIFRTFNNLKQSAKCVSVYFLSNFTWKNVHMNKETRIFIQCWNIDCVQILCHFDFCVSFKQSNWLW